MTRSLEARIEQLESRHRNIVVIFYRESEESFEQRKQRFRKEEGRELPDNAIIICYRRLDIKKSDTPIALKKSRIQRSDIGDDRTE